jgi:hypothetical protein
MKSVAKIILGFGLLALAACSGKGSVESRIHSVDNDVDNPGSPAIIEDDDHHSTPVNGKACVEEDGAYCLVTANESLISQCGTMIDGTIADKCPSNASTQCDIDGPDGVSYYVDSKEMTCDMLESFLGSLDKIINGNIDLEDL